MWPICESVKGKRCQLELVCPRRAVRIFLLPFTAFQLLHSIHHFIPNPLFSGLGQSYKLSTCPSYRLLRYAINVGKLQTRDFNAMYRNLRDKSQEETAVVGLFACDKLPCESCSHSIPSSFHPSLSLSFSPLPGELIDDIKLITSRSTSEYHALPHSTM